MKIGTEKISGQQNDLLRMARESQSPREVARAFQHLMRDSDIRAGREDIHPDWVEVFESKAELLGRVLPRKVFDDMKAFFGKLIPFDKDVRNIDPSQGQITFLLGAGSSKPSPSGIPTVKELLPQLLERARRLDRDDVTKLADFCEERDITNIEDLLTAAQLATFTSRSPTILRLLNYLLYGREVEGPEDEAGIYAETWESFGRRYVRRTSGPLANVSSVAFLQDTLQVLFGLLASTMLPAKPNKAHEAIANHAASHPNTVIVTTNYDCCMDLALEAEKQPFTYRVDFANRPTKHEGASTPTRLIKLHGSLNWYYCETCQEVQHVDIGNIVEQYTKDKSPYPVIGICRDCGGQRRGLLVPPLAMKFDVAPPLTPLLSDAGDAFDSADVIVVVGFSFADADVYISRMLSKAMQTKGQQRLIIVDPDQDIVSRVRRKFKASIPNFDENRIMRLASDCAESLPKFLGGELRAQEEKPNGKKSAAKGPVRAKLPPNK